MPIVLRTTSSIAPQRRKVRLVTKRNAAFLTIALSSIHLLLNISFIVPPALSPPTLSSQATSIGRQIFRLGWISIWPQAQCLHVLSYEAEGYLVNVNMFREVLKLCKEAQLADVALWVFRKMEQSFNIGADTVMYNVVIRLCCKNGDIETAEKLIGEMSLNGLYPDLITYMAIVEGLCDAGRPEHAYSLLKVMREHKCSTNLVILSAILDGLCRSGSMKMALELLDEMEKGGDCRPNVVIYTSVIPSFCMRGQWMKALDILDRMKASGCHANHVTVFTVLGAQWLILDQ